MNKKASSQGFSIYDLPKNRWAQFLDILKHQALSIISICFLFLVACLPFILIRYYHLLSLTELVESSHSLSSGEVQAAYLSYYLLRLPAFIFIALFLSGILRIYKKMGFGEGYFLFSDFVAGIKENFLNILGLTFFYWLLSSLLFYASELSLAYSNSWIFYLMYAVEFSLLLPYYALSCYLSCVYSDGFWTKIVATAKLFLKHFPTVLLFSLLSVAPLLLLLIPLTYVQLFVPIIYAGIFLPLASLSLVLFYNHLFDLDINCVSFPSLVGKGLRPQEKEDTH
jgi:hypothetical protein